MDTDADGAYRFHDEDGAAGSTEGLLPYVQFDAEGNPLAAGDPAATDDVLAAQAPGSREV